MRTMQAGELVAAGSEAMGIGDFGSAETSFLAALEIEPLPGAHEGLANIGYINDDWEAARRGFELAYRGYRDAGDLKAAAMAAVHLAGVHYWGFANEAASHGWLSRAERLLDRVGRCVERGYLALALVACNIRDANQLEASASVALELALEFGDSDLEARALADGGLALINQGRISEGFAKMDESMAAVSAGEVSPIFAGTIFCALLTACERTGDIRRAEEWSRTCSAFMDQAAPGKVAILHSHCRTAYGVVLCDTGRWNEGEAEILAGIDPSGPSGTKAVLKIAEGVGALASLRLTQGRVEEAAGLLAPYADTFEVCEPMARLHLARGEPDLAVAVIVRALDDLVGDRLRAGRLLELLVETELVRDNVDAAERALERLIDCAEASEGSMLRAAAAFADARIARHREDWPQAIELLRGAAKLIGNDERPILAGRIRFALAEALAKTGDSAVAVDEARSALATFERLGAGRDADQAAALLRELGAPGRPRSRGGEASDSPLTARERDVLALLGEGLTNAEIAQRLYITPKTAEHHVGRILSKLGVRSRTEAAALAASSSSN